MTDTVDDGANRVLPLQAHEVERTEDYPYDETSEVGTRVDVDKPFYVGHWILRLPLAAPMRTLYEHQVAISNRDLMAYFNTSKYISERDRQLAREPFLSMLERVNAYQPWLNVIDCFKTAVRYTAVFPSWLVFATAASVLLWTSTPLAIKISYICLCFLCVLVVFGGYLRDPEHPWSRAAGLLGFLVAVVSGWLLLGTWSKLSVWAACGVLLLGAAGTLIATLASVFVLDILNLRTRVAVYLIGVGVLAFGATSTRPHQPSWLAQSISSALWASLALIVGLGVVHLLSYLVTSVLWHWKNRRYTVAELVQTLAWIGMSLEDEERPENERSELALTPPTLAQIGTAWSLEYIAKLIEHFLPRQLPTWDHASDRIIAERCRGMACAVRQIKLSHVLGQSISASEMASRLVPAIGPIVLGDWNKIAWVELQEQPIMPKSRRTLRILGRIVSAVAPLAVVLALRATASDVPSDILNQALAITITWLVVSVITLIDPASGERTSNVTSLLSVIRSTKSA